MMTPISVSHAGPNSHLAAPLRLSDAPRSVLTLALRYLGRLAARGWGKPMQSQFRTIQAYPKDGRYLSGKHGVRYAGTAGSGRGPMVQATTRQLITLFGGAAATAALRQPASPATLAQRPADQLEGACCYARRSCLLSSAAMSARPFGPCSRSNALSSGSSSGIRGRPSAFNISEDQSYWLFKVFSVVPAFALK
jgi:hypothetical protein